MKDIHIELQNFDPKPKYLAQKCPVCNGWGTVSFKKVQCHACSGKGFVLIPIHSEREKEYGDQR